MLWLNLDFWQMPTNMNLTKEEIEILIRIVQQTAVKVADAPKLLQIINKLQNGNTKN